MAILKMEIIFLPWVMYGCGEWGQNKWPPFSVKQDKIQFG
jgi:hypothetical protein